MLGDIFFATVMMTVSSVHAQTVYLSMAQCSNVIKIEEILTRRLGASEGPSSFGSSLRQFVGERKDCRGSAMMRISSYRDIALYNLAAYYLSSWEPKIDTRAIGWIVSEVMKSERVAQVLPSGLGELGNLLASERELSEEEFRQTPLFVWAVPYATYLELRAKGFNVREILMATEDTWVHDLDVRVFPT